jgi:arsenite methyltransferase
MTDMPAHPPGSPGDQIRALYTELALNPDKDFGWGKGKENARHLGYDEQWLQRLPVSLWQSAAAVGNPFSLGHIMPGETVLDLGCGTGADLCIAALLAGDHGHVVGVDITPAMIAKAEENITELGLTNVTLHVADIAALPLEDLSVDVVISNGAINLSPHKPCVFQEVFRVLRTGGRFLFADMVRDGAPDVPSCGSWADCVSGTVEPQRYIEMLAAAGFREAQMVSLTDYRTAPTTVGATFRAIKKNVTDQY